MNLNKIMTGKPKKWACVLLNVRVAQNRKGMWLEMRYSVCTTPVGVF